jgi:hypothetical protein
MKAKELISEKHLWILDDAVLRPLFIEMVGKKIQSDLADHLQMRYTDQINYRRDLYQSISVLTDKLKPFVSEENMLAVINEIGAYYLETIKSFSYQPPG